MDWVTDVTDSNSNSDSLNTANYQRQQQLQPQHQQQSSSSQRRRLTKKPPSQHLQHTHSYSVAGDGRFDAQSLQSKRSSSSLKRAPSAPLQNTGRSSNASNNSSPRHLPKANHPLPPPASAPLLSPTTTSSSTAAAANNSSPFVTPPLSAPPGDFFASTTSAPSYQVAAPTSSSVSHHSHTSPPTSTTATFPATSASAGGAPAASGAGVGFGSDFGSGIDIDIGIRAGTAPSTSTRVNQSQKQGPSFQEHHQKQKQHRHLQQRLSGSQQLPLRPLRSKASEEFVGAPFDGDTIISQLDKAAARVPFPSRAAPQPSARPQPPPLSPDLRIMSPSLRRSASFHVSNTAMSEKSQAARANDAPVIASKRYSDESKESKPPSVLRKKSGFSGLMSTLVGSPKKPVISAPENPVHVTHVGYDSATGQFTVRLHPDLQLPMVVFTHDPKHPPRSISVLIVNVVFFRAFPKNGSVSLTRVVSPRMLRGKTHR